MWWKLKVNVNLKVKCWNKLCMASFSCIKKQNYLTVNEWNNQSALVIISCINFHMHRYRLFTVGKVVLKVKRDILYLLSAKWVSSMFGKNNWYYSLIYYMFLFSSIILYISYGTVTYSCVKKLVRPFQIAPHRSEHVFILLKYKISFQFVSKWNINI